MSDPLFPEPLDPDSTIMIPRPGGGRRPPPPQGYVPPMEPPTPSGYPPPTAPPASWPSQEAPPLVGMNPLVAAAAGLLSTVPTIRRTISHQNPLALREYLLRAIGDFEANARRANVSPEHILIARYSLCTMIDETVMVMPWGASSSWSRESLLVTLHKEGFGGEKFFLLLEKALEDPRRNIDLIELMYTCLALGFEGRYRVLDGGRNQLDALRDRVYNVIRRERGEFDRDLSPHWRGVQKRAKPLVRRLPAWIVVAAVCLLAFVFYVVYLALLARGSDPVFSTVAAIRADPGNLQRAQAALAPPEPTTPRLRPLLAAEIQQGLIDVVEDATGSRLVIRGDSLFASGSAEVQPALLPLIDRIGQELARVPGAITVTGHTDNVPTRTLRFPSNYELSVERARGVSARLLLYIRDPARVRTEGVADSRPLVPNTSAEARARNRRVEIVLRNPA
ncbi:type IVB secretion system protein IcmH/DotU [Piscinibacter sakaiensis]|uniref:Outer membrane protein ImpK/VasF, OmpA/MotB domain n=1 Tax=Piscinibacter sakaiensis TaxID=1547922 RepID=A0A0K8NY68_PISS1|nr:type IVB secretion system protein IcmH/DotU [Piscinibacter sakaiensis]GAP34875.1 outer membrane protein ImpK/VasF, OmpA/MotB domain [Piscinibacter sakaiensis]